MTNKDQIPNSSHDNLRLLENVDEGYASILESTPDAMLMVNQQGKIQFVNSQIEKVFGYHKDELLGQTVEILIPEPYKSRHPEHVRKYFSPENP